MKALVIACSLSPTSRSARLAARLAEAWTARGAEVELVDLREHPLPFCDADACYDDPEVQTLAAKIEAADAVALAVPIYNYDVGGAARNLIAVTGSAWNEKLVGLLGTAGGERSYMSLLPLANSLMLDFRCLVVPRFVYASRHSFQDGELNDSGIEQRIDALAGELQRLGEALVPARQG